MLTYLVLLLIIVIIIFVYIQSNQFEYFRDKITYKVSPVMTKTDTKNLIKGQTIMTNMLQTFDLICRSHGLKYWSLGGTLIGSIRHNGWIPWDGDIDVGMLDTDYAKLKKLTHLFPK